VAEVGAEIDGFASLEERRIGPISTSEIEDFLPFAYMTGDKLAEHARHSPQHQPVGIENAGMEPPLGIGRHDLHHILSFETGVYAWELEIA